MKIAYRNITSTEPIVFVPCSSGVAYEAGLPITVASGAAVVATGTTKPTHICVQKRAGVTDEEVGAILITPDMVFETTLTVAGTSLTVGKKVTIAAGGAGVTATTDSGIAEIVGFPKGTKGAGDPVYVKF